MTVSLEDLTKEELINLFRHYQYKDPPQHELHGIIWERMTNQALCIMNKACEDMKLVTGKADYDSITRWWDYNNDFDYGMTLSDKAQSYFDTYLNTH